MSMPSCLMSMPACLTSCRDCLQVLCSRLLAIEYIDLAEQSLQALEKLSHEHPQVLWNVRIAAPCQIRSSFIHA
jgi:hypothetical protein